MNQADQHASHGSRTLLKVGLPALVLAVATLMVWQIKDSAPRVGRRVPPPQTRLVEVQPVIQEDVRVTLSGLGTVIPSRQLILYPEVTGLIEQMRDHLLPGSQIDQGETLIHIAPLEYQIQLQKQQADVALADSELQKEMGQQAIARQELELMGQTLSPEQEALVLRQPQLNSAKARLAQAKAAMAQAQINLDRTQIKAPFKAQVISRSVETGSRVSTSSELMNIVATDEFWLELEIPVEHLQWLEFGKKKALVTLSSPAWQNKKRNARLLSFSPSLNSGSRMAKVIISINDPLALTPQNQGEPKILINDLVRAEIAGQSVAQAVVVPDEFLRNGNQVWLLSATNMLEVRTVEPVYRDSHKAIIASGLETGEQLITSSLTVAVQGMSLRTVDNQQTSQRPEKKTSEGSPSRRVISGGALSGGER